MTTMMVVEASAPNSTDSPSDSWQDALLGFCSPIAICGEDEHEIRSLSSLEASRSVVPSKSTWQDAVDLLCRAIVIDEQLEEEAAWKSIMAERRCIPTCGAFDSDDDNDVVG